MSNEITQLIAVIKENEQQNKLEMSEMRHSIKEMSDSFNIFYKHVAIVDEERKHDAEFKKEVRTFMKEFTPILLKAKDIQEIRGKLLIALGSFLMLGVLGAFFNFS